VEEQILVRREGAIVTVTFNRPEKRNAFTVAMYGRLGAILDELSADDSVRCVVLEGAGGKAFSAGSDIGEFDASRAASEEARDYAEFVNRETDKVWHCPHPTIARIQGVCVGGGLEIATMCDVRIASSDSRFGIPVNRVGLTVDYHELALISELIGRRNTLELLIDGRIIDAGEAVAKGLVSRIVAPEMLDAEIESSARRIVEAAPLVNRWHKRFVRRLGDPRPLDAAEADEAFGCFDTEDYRIGTAAFAEKRKPAFVGR
jgi:enoyl-CoA hydratase/carnithine racemase